MRLRTLLIDWPARIVDAVWFGYWLVIAALSLLCFVNVLIVLVFLAFRMRVGW